MHLAELQEEQGRWLAHNFPNADAWEALAGAVEEMGELAHAHLKGHNRIRGLRTSEAVQQKKADTIGDIIIYLASYCNTNDIDLDDAVTLAWSEVKDRDWVANPETGRPS